MRGRRSEIDYLNGYIVRKGKSLAIDTPANQALYSIVKLLESAFAADQA
jgi:2-dehydropantoate 2-reductase